MLWSFTVFTSSPWSSVTAYPKDFFALLIPNEVTTTSSKALSVASITLIVVDESTETDWEAYPTKLKISVSPLEALIEYSPSKSVETPFVVPSTKTVAPGYGTPFSSVTVPLIDCACMENPKANNIRKVDRMVSNFVFICFIFV